MNQLKINHPAAIVCIVILSALGFLWYGPIFGDIWMELEGISQADIEANQPGAGTWITNFVSTIASVYLMAWLFTKLNVRSLTQGVLYGFLIGFVFVLLSRMNNDMFALRPYELSWIVGGFNALGLTITGLILGAWRKTA